MRSRSNVVLAAIVILTLVAVWVSLPKDILNIAGAKDDIEVHKGLDLQGGLQVVLEARPAAGQEVNRDVLAGTRDTIERRVSGLGVSEPVIQTQGDNKIVVELPGLEDTDRAVELLKETALLEIIDTQGAQLAEGTRVNTSLGGATVPGATSATPTAEGTPEPGASPAAEASPTTAPAGANNRGANLHHDRLRSGHQRRLSDPGPVRIARRRVRTRRQRRRQVLRLHKCEHRSDRCPSSSIRR